MTTIPRLRETAAVLCRFSLASLDNAISESLFTDRQSILTLANTTAVARVWDAALVPGWILLLD